MSALCVRTWTCFFVTLIVFCVGVTPAVAGWTAEFVPTQIGTANYSGVVLITPPVGHTYQNPNGCSYTDAYAIDATGFGAGGHKEQVSLALGAFLNGKPIKLNIAGCSATPGWPLVISMQVLQ